MGRELKDVFDQLNAQMNPGERADFTKKELEKFLNTAGTKPTQKDLEVRGELLTRMNKSHKAGNSLREQMPENSKVSEGELSGLREQAHRGADAAAKNREQAQIHAERRKALKELGRSSEKQKEEPKKEAPQIGGPGF